LRTVPPGRGAPARSCRRGRHRLAGVPALVDRPWPVRGRRSWATIEVAVQADARRRRAPVPERPRRGHLPQRRQSPAAPRTTRRPGPVV